MDQPSIPAWLGVCLAGDLQELPEAGRSSLEQWGWGSAGNKILETERHLSDWGRSFQGPWLHALPVGLLSLVLKESGI